LCIFSFLSLSLPLLLSLSLKGGKVSHLSSNYRIEEEREEDSAKRDMSQEIVKQSEFDMQFMESAMNDHMQKCQEIVSHW
jgi:hypothetical protein